MEWNLLLLLTTLVPGVFISLLDVFPKLKSQLRDERKAGVFADKIEIGVKMTLVLQISPAQIRATDPAIFPIFFRIKRSVIGEG